MSYHVCGGKITLSRTLKDVEGNDQLVCSECQDKIEEEWQILKFHKCKTCKQVWTSPTWEDKLASASFCLHCRACNDASCNEESYCMGVHPWEEGQRSTSNLTTPSPLFEELTPATEAGASGDQKTASLPDVTSAPYSR